MIGSFTENEISLKFESNNNSEKICPKDYSYDSKAKLIVAKFTKVNMRSNINDFFS